MIKPVLGLDSGQTRPKAIVYARGTASEAFSQPMSTKAQMVDVVCSFDDAAAAEHNWLGLVRRADPHGRSSCRSTTH
jgi:hypothetical protein